MDWLTAWKIPVGAYSKIVFDWMKTHLTVIFDAISYVLESLISGILWLLQAPPALLIIALFVALTWALQRNWKVCLGIALGWLFVINQGYWKETTESLTLIIASCAVCLGLGVPIGIAAAHRPHHRHHPAVVSLEGGEGAEQLERGRAARRLRGALRLAERLGLLAEIADLGEVVGEAALAHIGGEEIGGGEDLARCPGAGGNDGVIGGDGCHAFSWVVQTGDFGRRPLGRRRMMPRRSGPVSGEGRVSPASAGRGRGCGRSRRCDRGSSAAAWRR